MIEIVRIIVGIVFIILGIPIGNYLAKQTKEELKQGQIWFKLIALLSIAGSVVGLLFSNDALFFSFLFVATVTSRSLRK